MLPTLGGAPAVWSVALVFFQAALLVGYLYAHLLTRYLSGRGAVGVHLLVLLAATLALPLGMAAGWGRPPAQGAELWLIGLFAASIGLPFVALSANAPLLQAWFARTAHPSAGDPYFLYAASNVGSFLALLSFPFLIEPFSRLGQQVDVWSSLFYVLIALIALCGVLLVRSRGVWASINESDPAAETVPSGRDAATWMGLAAVPSAFLIAVTAHISTDIAAAPFLWVIPLALYLLTFVLVFQQRRVVPHQAFVWLQPPLIALLIGMLVVTESVHISAIAAVNFAAFFVTAMVCHGELARRRPAARHLTTFYVWVAAGGVIGGTVAGMVAPRLFNWVVEYPLLIVAGILCRPGLALPRGGRSWAPILTDIAAVAMAVIAMSGYRLWSERLPFEGIVAALLVVTVIALRRNPLRLAIAFGGVLVLIYAYLAEGSSQERVRSFFGVHKVYDLASGPSTVRVLMHGTTVHGAQLIDGPYADTDGRPTTSTYYSARSPMARVFAAARANNTGAPVRVATVGLGAGTVACLLQPDDSLDFYEIDQTVVRIALDRERFTYIARCKPDSTIIVGDARLTLADAPDGSYDLIVLDAFSSDAVPVHLLTREAMALYLRKLAPGGIVAAHVMNRHLELPSVVAGIAAANGLVTRVMRWSANDRDRYLFNSEVAAVARSVSDFGALLTDGDWDPQAADPSQRVWTDDYSNIVGALLRHIGS